MVLAVKAARSILIVSTVIAGMLVIATVPAFAEDCGSGEPNPPPVIERIRPDATDGEGYRMTYCVAVPLETYWRFKTAFENDFLVGNPHIRDHRYLGRKGNVVLTENRYTHNSKRLFRWETTVHDRDYRMDFKLLNPEEAGQQFHFGTIRLTSRGRTTMVSQEARFQFSGAAFWAFYPWRGGMRSFLQSFVSWEQKTAREWQAQGGEANGSMQDDPVRPRTIHSIKVRYTDN